MRVVPLRGRPTVGRHHEGLPAGRAALCLCCRGTGKAGFRGVLQRGGSFSTCGGTVCAVHSGRHVPGRHCRGVIAGASLPGGVVAKARDSAALSSACLHLPRCSLLPAPEGAAPYWRDPFCMEWPGGALCGPQGYCGRGRCVTWPRPVAGARGRRCRRRG